MLAGVWNGACGALRGFVVGGVGKVLRFLWTGVRGRILLVVLRIMDGAEVGCVGGC